MGRSGPHYFWWMICAGGCTSEKTSQEPAGNPAWLSEKCPTPKCDRPVVAYVLPPAPEEKGPRA